MTKTIYAKLQEARKRLNDADLQKTGKNAFGTGFKYFELKDFMPSINEIFNEVGLIGVTDFEADTLAYLHIHDTEQDCQPISFSCQKAEAGLRQGTPIQNVGAQQTYVRRYLWVQAMEITDDDQVDSLADDKKVSSLDHNKQLQKSALAVSKTETNWTESIYNCQTLAQLSAVWASIPAKNKTQDIIVKKDKKKLELTPIDQQIAECTNNDELTVICEKLTDIQQKEFEQLIADKVDEFMLKEEN